MASLDGSDEGVTLHVSLHVLAIMISSQINIVNIGDRPPGTRAVRGLGGLEKGESPREGPPARTATWTFIHSQVGAMLRRGVLPLWRRLSACRLVP